MTLSIGSRLGPYEIRAAMGAGGMGEVYRGRDTDLNRDVALKILGEQFANDLDYLARFKREAQVLASLNHPHIGAIYGVADFPGGRALVLELVEGLTLADRIDAGPIPLGEALLIARQIAEALEAAHQLGIIHRDLKPANVKLRPDGVVKVLDFGLAKTLESSPASLDATRSSTITHSGAILGTAPYMSPEQAIGGPADKRSDVWAFGCVVFEMLTGQRVFAGEGVTNTLALVLTSEPTWSLLPPETPPAIRRLLRRCLARDRSQRLADLADARLEIDERETEVTAHAAGAAVPARPVAKLARWLPWVMAAAAVAVGVWFANRAAWERSAADSRVVRSSILLPGRLGSPPATGYASSSGANLALSPDGGRLAMVITDSSGRAQIWLRPLDATEARPLAGTENGVSPFWSPDGRWLAFVANGSLKKLDPSGGSPVTLCDSAVVGGAWSRQGIILFTHRRNQALAQIPGAGGTPSMVTHVDTRSWWRHTAPFFLPDGRHFLFAGIGYAAEDASSHVSSLGAREPSRLPVNSVLLRYAKGYLLFSRGATLMAQPFDERRLAPVGAAFPLTERLRASGPSGRFADVSAAGTLVFQEDPTPGFNLAWHDREGHVTGTLGDPAEYGDLTLSPDGRRALVSVGEPGSTNRDLWIFDVARGLRTRLTANPARETHCIWSPDGGQIVFDSQRSDHRDLYQKAADGTGAEELLLADEFDKNPMGWSPDGRFILYARRKGADVKVWVLPLVGDRRPYPLRETTAPFQLGGWFSPDGRWVAYDSNESGRAEVYVAPFPGPGPATQVSTEGGLDARWNRNGKELFYRALDGQLMAASVSATGPHFDVVDVKRLFMLPRAGPRFSLDVSPDGQRFLAVTARPQVGSEPLTLVQNWPALLKR